MTANVYQPSGWPVSGVWPRAHLSVLCPTCGQTTGPRDVLPGTWNGGYCPSCGLPHVPSARLFTTTTKLTLPPSRRQPKHRKPGPPDLP